MSARTIRRFPPPALLMACTLVGCIATSTPNEPDPTGNLCGGIAGVPCADGFYCAYDDGTCDVADRSGTCQTTPDACIEIFAPVCGCDGKTYSNDCMAAVAGVSIDFAGECP